MFLVWEKRTNIYTKIFRCVHFDGEYILAFGSYTRKQCKLSEWICMIFAMWDVWNFIILNFVIAWVWFVICIKVNTSSVCVCVFLLIKYEMMENLPKNWVNISVLGLSVMSTRVQIHPMSRMCAGFCACLQMLNQHIIKIKLHGMCSIRKSRPSTLNFTYYQIQ